MMNMIVLAVLAILGGAGGQSFFGVSQEKMDASLLVQGQAFEKMLVVELRNLEQKTTGRMDLDAIHDKQQNDLIKALQDSERDLVKRTTEIEKELIRIKNGTD